MTGLAVGLVVVVLVVGAMVFARYTKHPEQTAGHAGTPEDTASDRYYRGVDRPAGPDADGGPGAAG